VLRTVRYVPGPVSDPACDKSRPEPSAVDDTSGPFSSPWDLGITGSGPAVCGFEWAENQIVRRSPADRS
jgi:hypothetical protein